MASSVLSNKNQNITKSITLSNSYSVKIKKQNPTVKINEVLPFRVRFTNIGISGDGLSIPPIGLAIIGLNNYIL